MFRRRTAFMVLVVALVLVTGAVAAGTTIPTLTASRTAVTYPHSAILTVGSDTTPSVIMRRLAGESEWTTFGPTVEATLATVWVRPKSTAAYEVVSDGVSSDPVTITVAAQLSKPQVNRRGHKGRNLTIKGWVAPLHAGGNVQLTFYRLEKVGVVVTTAKHNGTTKTRIVRKNRWVQHGDAVDVSLSRLNSQKSKWSYKWSPSARGTWKIVVSHEDVGHVHSSASMKAVIKH
jgi:hypothetical protein